MFWAKEANFTTLQTQYTLVQCTPDLSDYDCNRCLHPSVLTFKQQELSSRIVNLKVKTIVRALTAMVLSSYIAIF